MKLPEELKPIDAYMMRWASWVGKQFAELGFPAKSMTARMIEWHEIGLEREKLYPSCGKDKAPGGVMLIDRAVARMPPVLRDITFIEYFSGEQTLEVKAKKAGLLVYRYKQRAQAALWHVHGQVAAQLDRNA
jgi:hypothetical protein